MLDLIDYPIYEIDGWQGNVIDDDGVEWIITGEEGWSSAADARAALVDIPDDDGAADAPTYESARTITLTGVAIAPSWLEQNRAKERLNRVAYTSRGLYPLTITEHHLTRLAYVRRSGSQKIGDRQGNAFDFVLSLVAPDPARYDSNLQTLAAGMPGTIVLVGRTYPRTYPLTYPTNVPYQPLVNAYNLGNRNTGAQITLSSGIDSPGVINGDSGASLQFDVSLGAADSLVVDLAAKTAVLNGTSSRRGSLLTGSSWFTLVPGENNLRLIGIPNGTGNPTMTVAYRSAWK